jgi:hypothetical protein
MVQSIDNALVTEFSDMVHQEAQQLTSKLKDKVKIKKMEGDVFAYDGLGRVEAREVNDRYSDASFDDIEHTRRKISRRRFVINLPIDASDVRGALLNPESEYARAVAAGMLRQYDRVIYDAAFKDVQTGRDFDSTVNFADDGGLTVDATGGLTYAKLLEIKQNFLDNDVGDDPNDQLYLTILGKQHTNLMSEVQLTSGDFSRDYVIDKGTIVRALGMELVMFAANVPNPIIPENNSEHALVAASTRGLCLGISKEMSISIKERDDKIETTQVQIIAQMGGVRTEGALVQKVRVTA